MEGNARSGNRQGASGQVHFSQVPQLPEESGGIGPALLDSLDIEKASDKELERIAGRYGFSMDKYRK